MSEESRLSQPVSLSHAKKIRRANDNNSKIEISEVRLREIMSECAEKQEQRQRKMITEVVNKEVWFFSKDYA